MVNPYLIEGPAVISFSGGRTSGYMLRRVLDVGLRPDVHVVFANTGKERLETLDFVRKVEQEWDVPVRWVERATTTDGFIETDYSRASRSGEPFTQLIMDKRMLPSPPRRWCTSELKIEPMRKWMLAQGYQQWSNVVGIRADEPRRVAKIRGEEEARSLKLINARWKDQEWDVLLPLADAGVTEADVLTFWERNAFNLNLSANMGNCDLCFLKKLAYKQNIVRDHPELATWWIEQEQRIGHQFRNDHPSYDAMRKQPDLFKDGIEQDLIECFCTD